MCGIAGYFGSGDLDSNRVTDCLSLMRRRGPDARGFYYHRHASGRGVWLLHSRLKIIDLDDRANQPYLEADQALVFNGEIYNYLELGELLAGRSHQFRTKSDTEVLMKLLIQDGPLALERCEGMWAFAFYDEREGILTLSRDRFGEKPLYLMEGDHGWYFGSEVKFIQALRGRSLRLNPNQLRRYLVNGYKSLYKTTETFFENLTEVPPATNIRLGAGKPIALRYWQPRYAPDESMHYLTAVKGARDALVESVKIRMRADVPLAFCLSGGVDSNSLIAIARRLLGRDVHGFTIVNMDKRYDERETVSHVVRELGIRHTEIPVDTRDFLPQLRQLVRQHDAPVYTINYFAQWRLMESIDRSGYRISVSGTGADELFTGYYDHHLAYLREVNGVPEIHSKALQAWTTHIQPLVRNPYLIDPELFVKEPEFREHIYLNHREFAAYLTCPWSEPFQESRYTDCLLRNRMLNEVFHEAVPVILHEDDLNAMHFSIENRSPFLDRRLFEWCFTIPSHHLIRDGFGKAVLRDAMSGIVPENVLRNRRKVGFNAPIRAYLNTDDPLVRAYLLDESPIFEWVHRKKIADLIDKPDLTESESKLLFYFVSGKTFVEEFGG